MKFPVVVAVLCVTPTALHRDNLMHVSPLDRNVQEK